MKKQELFFFHFCSHSIFKGILGRSFRASMEEIFLAIDERAVGASLMQATGETFSEATFESFQKYLKQYDVREGIKSLNILIIKGGGHFSFLTQERRSQIHNAIRLLNLSH